MSERDRDAALTGGYLAALGENRAAIREKGSRFLAVVRQAGDEESAKKALGELRRSFPDATHHCWAWRLGEPARERCSDDGEPAGTAGMPILQVLEGAGVSDVVAVVVRWFGGTKLGKGGLARAYAAAVREAMSEMERVERVPVVIRIVEVSYAGVGAVKRLVHPPEVELLDEQYGKRAKLTLRVREDKVGEIEEMLAEIEARTALDRR